MNSAKKHLKNEETKHYQKKNYKQKDVEEVKESYQAKRDLGYSKADKNPQRTNPEPGNIIGELQGVLAKLL
jgi:hypothetical protein